jgi:hypothetical protein
MAVSKRALLLSSAALTFFTSRYAPHASVSRSNIWNFVAVFFLQLFAKWFWEIIVYPLFLSPLRHLPQAPVSRSSE